jgi:hypothetical protein
VVGAMVLAVSTAIGGPAARCGDVCGVRADKIGGLARGWMLVVECLRSGWCEDNRGSTVTASCGVDPDRWRSVLRLATTREGFDDNHAAAAAWTAVDRRFFRVGSMTADAFVVSL